MNDGRVNLPLSIFDFLWKSHNDSRYHIKSYIPYARVLSEIFFREGIMDMIKEAIAEDGPDRFPKFCLLNTKCDIFRG